MRHRKKKGISVVEYVAVASVCLLALGAMREPIARVFMGRWRTLGDSFMHGQQYELGKTLECGQYTGYDHEGQQWAAPLWYEYSCYERCMQGEVEDCSDYYSLGERRSCCANECQSNACEDITF